MNTGQACPVNQKKKGQAMSRRGGKRRRRRRKRKRRIGGRQCLGKEKKKCKEKHMYEVHVQLYKGIFFQKWCLIYPFSFLSILRRKLFGGPGEKYLGPTIYFPSFPPNQIHSKKVFLPIFSPKFSIHLISYPNKHTLSKWT